jgi:rod shape-determining protein MreC
MPVKISRNGVRFIAEGNGNFRNLTLRYVSPSSEIIVGDLLVSSGLGKRYPAGYPVGLITSINPIKGSPYLNVNVKPTAQLDRSRYLLLVSQSIEKFKVGQDEK